MFGLTVCCPLVRRVRETATVHAENVWYAAHERFGDTEGYMNDLDRAKRLVQTVDRSGTEPRQCNAHIGLEIRYSLMSASLNSLAQSIPPTLLAALVRKASGHLRKPSRTSGCCPRR